MKVFSNSKSIILLILFWIVLIEGSYRFFRAIQYKSLDIVVYPLTVKEWGKGAFSLEFKPKVIQKFGVQYILKREMRLSALLKATELQYKNRFGEANIRVNKFINYASAKDNNEVRIMTIGGSLTYGAGVNDNKTYSAYLEQKLNRLARNLKITVINGGASGKNIEERKEEFRFLLSDFSTDILILYLGHNNVTLPNSIHCDNFVFSKEKVFNKFSWPERFLLIYKDIFEAIRYAFFNRERNKYLNSLKCANQEDSLLLNQNFANQTNNFRKNIEDIIQIAKKKGAVVILSNQLIWVDNFPISKDKNLLGKLNEKLINTPENLSALEGFYLLHEKFMDTFREIAKEIQGVYFLDLYKNFNQLHPQAVLQDRVHLTPKGNKMVAEAMAEYIVSNHLIEEALRNRGSNIRGIVLQNRNLDAAELMLSNTLKLMAKSFVKTMPLDKFKKKQIKSISKKTEEDFNRRFMKFYEEIEGTGLENILNLNPDFSKEEAISRINALTKEEMFLVIDSVPDYVIVDKIKEYFKKNRQDSSDGQNILEKTKHLFDKAVKKATE